MDGWKTWTGGVIKICTGAAAILGAIAALITKFVDPDNPIGIGFDAAMVAITAGVYAIGQGFSTIGLGHKLEKARDAQIKTSEATQAMAHSAAKTAVATEEMVAEMTKPIA